MRLAKVRRRAAADKEIAAARAAQAAEAPAVMAAHRLPSFCCSRLLKHCLTARTIRRSREQAEHPEIAAAETARPRKRNRVRRAVPGRHTLMRRSAPKNRRPKSTSPRIRNGRTIPRGTMSMTAKNKPRSREKPLPVAWRLVALVSALVIVFAAAAHAQQYTCPISPVSGAGSDFHGQSLTNSNFAHQSLRNANFQNAVLTAPIFAGADLTGANFSGATFKGDASNPLAAPNFLFANLDTACFIKATFQAPADFTGATLTCADF